MTKSSMAGPDVRTFKRMRAIGLRVRHGQQPPKNEPEVGGGKVGWAELIVIAPVIALALASIRIMFVSSGDSAVFSMLIRTMDARIILLSSMVPFLPFYLTLVLLLIALRGGQFAPIKSLSLNFRSSNVRIASLVLAIAMLLISPLWIAALTVAMVPAAGLLVSLADKRRINRPGRIFGIVRRIGAFLILAGITIIVSLAILPKAMWLPNEIIQIDGEAGRTVANVLSESEDFTTLLIRNNNEIRIVKRDRIRERIPCIEKSWDVLDGPLVFDLISGSRANPANPPCPQL
ncbi:hypothetical protein [Micromonospora noduli]|uniref:hypothetical protein n=1 Tax=Micromonospora noduli TaxID=709876 RepID=UPI000DC42982|nr:hypothetical protein [Micromonospora noduli]RAO15222.1 hypothetical protein LUPAC07_03497 [Micromonospora noduli]